MYIMAGYNLNDTFDLLHYHYLHKTLWDNLEQCMNSNNNMGLLTAALVVYTDKHPIEIKFLKIRVTKRSTFYFVMGFVLTKIVSTYYSIFI